MSGPGLGAHLRAVLMPVTAGLAVPWLLARTDAAPREAWPRLGIAVATCGWTLVGWTVILFARRGLGTLAPWDPTRRLVVAGPYAHVRNPMISGVATAIAGFAIAAGSPEVLAWAGAFVAVNHAYFVVSEEPGLRRRFGAEYERYAAFVPRWVPKLRSYVER